MSDDGGSHWLRLNQISERVSICDGAMRFADDFQSLTLPEQVLMAAHWFEYEVANGGLYQFFGNSTGVLAPEAVVAFHALGMPRVAHVLTEAMARLGREYPRDREKRCAKLVGHGRAVAAHDDELYRLFDHENGGFDQAASAYAARHGV